MAERSKNLRVLPSLSETDEDTAGRKNKPLTKSMKNRKEAKLDKYESTEIASDKTELIEHVGQKTNLDGEKDDGRSTSLKEGNEEIVPGKVSKKKLMHGKEKEGWKENKKKTKKSATKKEINANQEEKVEDVFVDDGHVMQVLVHRSDRLKFNELMAHPVVSISLVDASTGDYVKKSDKNRPVISRYENVNDKIDYIQPVLTLPFDFKHNQSVMPVWEDSIIINEAFNHFIKPGTKVIAFFQLKDFVEAQYINRHPQFQQGWFTIAWAFLQENYFTKSHNINGFPSMREKWWNACPKINFVLLLPFDQHPIQLVGSDGSANWGKKARLQLYKVPSFSLQKNNQVLEVFQWWCSESKTAYPSSLYITINKVKVVSEVTPSLRSFFPLQEEATVVHRGDQSQSSLAPSHSDQQGDAIDYLTIWSRLPGQICQIPKTLYKVLPSATKGCSCIKFSRDGRLLACGCHEIDCFPLVIYEVPSFHHLMTFKGHQGIVYDICWTRDSRHVLSASADGTVRIWSLELKDVKSSAFHPSYLYAAQIEPVENRFIVSGGYDKLIRIWSVTFSVDQDGSELCSAKQLQELSLHANYINIISFHPDGKSFYSGDANGSIMAWVLDAKSNPTAPASFKKELKIDGMKGAPITSLDVHPLGHKILAQSQNNKIQIIDLRVEATLHKLLGPTSIRSKLKSCFSADGSLVFSGSEDGRVYVWSSESGNQLSIYGDLNYNASICGLDTHPLDDYVAFCCHEYHQPIKIYKYDPSDPDSQNLPREGWKESLQVNAMEASESKSDILTLAKSSANDFDFLHSMRIQNIKSKLMEVTSAHQASTISYLRNLQEPISLSSLSAFNTPRRSIQPILTISAENEKEVKVVFKPSPSTMSKEIVIATENYSAQRSDELSFSKGDRIIVLHKDNDFWWMGYMPVTTKQGFFPANCVVLKAKSSITKYQSGAGMEAQITSNLKSDKNTGNSDELKYGSLLREKSSRGSSRRSSMSNRVSFNLDDSKEVVAKNSTAPLILSSTSTVRRGSKNVLNLNPIPEENRLYTSNTENTPIDSTGISMHKMNDIMKDLTRDTDRKPPLPRLTSTVKRNSLVSQ